MAEEIKSGEVPAYFRHGFRWYVLLVFALLDFLTLFTVMCCAGAAPVIMEQYQVDSQTFSLLTSITYLTGFLTCLFFGSFVDRFGARNTILGGLVLGVIGAVLRAAVPEFWAFLLGNFIIGFTFSALNAGVVKVMRAWFSPKQFSVAIGIYIAAASFGASIGMNSANLFPSLSWMLWFCVALYVVAIILTIFVKNRPADGPEDTVKESIIKYLGATLKYKSVWICSFAYFLVYTASTAGNIFMVIALQAVKGAPIEVAGLAGMLGGFGCLFGSALLPIITAKVGSTKPCLLVYSALMAITLAAAWLVPGMGTHTIVFLFLQAFFLGGLLSGTKALPGQIPELPAEYVGTAGGFQACLQNLGAFVGPTFIIAPIAGDNMFLLEMLIVAFVVLYFLWCLLIPKEVGRMNKA
ncbi:MAG: nitrate/nitrite transporter [Coriobacteriales bacterium]